MPDLLTPERLAEIRERLSKATAGPWVRDRLSLSVVETRSGRTPVNYFNDRHPDDIMDRDYREQDEADAAFIAHAHDDDIPALLSHIDAMREVLDACEYGGQTPRGSSACPRCRRGCWEGHAPDCRLAAALGKGVGA